MVSLDNKSSLARITWRGKGHEFGLEMVNRARESFMIYASPLIAMMDRQDEYVLVKYRDKEPERAINHHGGDIYGSIDDEGKTYLLTLYFGFPETAVQYCTQTNSLFEVMGTQIYRFEKGYLTSKVAELRTMVDEENEFDRWLREAEVTPLFASFMEGEEVT